MSEQDIEKLLPHYLVHSQLHYLTVVSLDGYYVYVNSYFNHCFSFVVENFIGQHAYLAIHEDDHEKCYQAVQQCLLTPHQIVRVLLRKPTATLHDFYWTDWEFSAFYNEHQILIGVLCVGHDITPTQKLFEQEYLLNAIYDSSNEPSTFVDTNLILRYNNKVAKQITKQMFGLEAAVGMHLQTFTLPQYQEEYLQLARKALSGEVITAEWATDQHWWRTTMFPVYDHEGVVVGITINGKDISERKRKEQQIIKQNISLRSIAWKQSHEVRRPLANILGLCMLLKVDDTATIEEKLLYIDLLMESAEELDAIIRDISVESNK